MPENRDKNGRFVAGNNANPGGRPKSNPQVKDILKSHSEEAALKLIELMRGKDKKLAFMAAQEILNRTEGKPEMMSKVELSTKEDTQIIFRWINEDTNNNITVSAENDAAGNSQADRDAQIQRDSSAP